MTTHNNWRGAPVQKRRAPSKQDMANIREAFDADALKRVCELDDFSTYAPRIELAPERGRERFYHYVDNGSDVLAVAHLDHVQGDPTCNVINTAAGLLVTSGALDDRLGAYVILELLPKLGIVCDWLLTTDEEMGASTAEEFPWNINGELITAKQYNWIIEFDRGGTDVVMYQYETDELAALVEDSGARVGTGSFSDIACLEHLGVAAFNWGVGYEDYHSARAHAWLEDTFRMVARFLRFHRANADTFLEHVPKQRMRRGFGSILDLDDEEYEEWLATHADDIDDEEFVLGDRSYSEGFYERWLNDNTEGV